MSKFDPVKRLLPQASTIEYNDQYKYELFAFKNNLFKILLYQRLPWFVSFSKTIRFRSKKAHTLCISFEG
jgi:hypothetical protein